MNYPETVMYFPSDYVLGRPYIRADLVAALHEEKLEYEQNLLFMQARLDEAKRAKENVIQQAKQWAMEAATQRAIVMEIGKLIGCEHDWEMVGAVRAVLNRRAE